MSGDEEWRPFRDGRYEVSSHGHVRHRVRGRNLRPNLSPRGYYRVRIPMRDGETKGRTVGVYVLVAECFIGPRPPGLHINHIDGNKLNNRPGNLEYITNRQNMVHATAMGLRARGEGSGVSKLTDADVMAMRTRWSAGESCAAIARDFGVTSVNVGFVVRNETWTHLPPAARGARRPSWAHQSKLCDGDVILMRIAYSGGARVGRLARRFGVNHSAVSNIVNYKAWTHVP